MKRKELIFQERKLKDILVMVLICIFLGLLYPVLAREFGDTYAFINGGVGGFIGGILLVLLEQNVGPQIIKTSFINKLLIKTTIYILIFIVFILVLVSFTRSIEAGQSYFQYLVGPQFNRKVFRRCFKRSIWIYDIQ